MNGELVGYAVLGRIPDLATEEVFSYELASAVFQDPVRADNAHGYYTTKGDPRTDYIVVEINQIPVRSRR